jgi:hypothetical protein
LPAGTAPVQLDDHGTTTMQTGRGALRVRVSVDTVAVDLVTCHLKSKLLSYTENRFNPRDEGERARYAGYALALRAAEAITLRDYATQCLGVCSPWRPARIGCRTGRRCCGVARAASGRSG